jgi:predicted Zn-dependent protease
MFFGPSIESVYDADDINAFALPGGFFYVNSGLILAADSESELAGVMAHEMSHVIAHHAARQMTRSQYARLGGCFGLKSARMIALRWEWREITRLPKRKRVTL